MSHSIFKRLRAWRCAELAKDIHEARTMRDAEVSEPALSAAGRASPSRQVASGIGLSAGGWMSKVLAVRQVIEKLPVVAVSAIRPSSPSASCAAA